MNKNQISQNNFLALIFASCGLLLLTVLIPYSPADPAWNRAASGATVSHWLGTFGAYFADILLSFIGYAAYLLPMGLIMMALRAWHSSSFSKDRASKGVIMLFVASLLLSMMFALHINTPINQTAVTGGGAFGQFFSGILIEVFSVRLLMTICTVLFLFCLRFILGFRWSHIADTLGTWTLLGVGKKNYDEDESDLRTEVPNNFNQDFNSNFQSFNNPNFDSSFTAAPRMDTGSANTAYQRLNSGMSVHPVERRANNLAANNLANNLANQATPTPSFDENQSLVGEIAEAMNEEKKEDKENLGKKLLNKASAFTSKFNRDKEEKEIIAEPKIATEPVINLLVGEEETQPPVLEETAEPALEVEDEFPRFNGTTQDFFNEDTELKPVESTNFVFQNSIPTPPITPMGKIPDAENPFAKGVEEDFFNKGSADIFAANALSSSLTQPSNPFEQPDLSVDMQGEQKLLENPFVSPTDNVELKLSPTLEINALVDAELADSTTVNKEPSLQIDISENPFELELPEEVKTEEEEEAKSVFSAFKVKLDNPSTNRINPTFVSEQKKTNSVEKKFMLPTLGILENSPMVEFLKDKTYKTAQSPLTVIMGKENNKNAIAKLFVMPNLLITGEGRNMGLYSLLISLFFKADLSDLKLLLADGGGLSLNRFGEIPHLITPIINDYDDLQNALNWLSNEIDRRIKILEARGVKKIAEYNEGVNKEKLPYIVAVIGEIAGVLPEVSLNQLIKHSHKAGVHLIIVAENASEELKNNILSLWDINADFSSSFKFQSSKHSINCPVIPVQNLSQLASYLRTQGIPHYEESINSPLYL